MATSPKVSATSTDLVGITAMPLSPDISSLHQSYWEDQKISHVGILSSGQFGQQQPYRFPQPFTVQINGAPLYPSPNPVFPLRNKTNLPTSSPNLLLQTILRDSQQLKAEYQQYKNETRAKLLKQETTIRNLKENLDNHQKKLLEMKLQKEVFVARESHAFQEIHDVVHSLLGKVSSFAQAESLNLEMISLPPPETFNVPRGNEEINCSSSATTTTFDDFAEKLRNLESKIVTFEGLSQGVLSTCRATEANLKLYMTSTNEKLDQIMLCIMENKGFTTPPQTAAASAIVGEDADISLYNASAEDNQDSDACDLSAVTGEISPSSNNKCGSQETKSSEIEKESLVYNKDKSLSSSSSSSNKEIQQQQQVNHRNRKRKTKSSCKPLLRRKLCRIKRRRREIVHYDDDVKQNQLCGDKDEDTEQPPVLSLPSRVAKHSRNRPESMPILQPEKECYFLQQEEKIEETKIPIIQQQENRKDDALIGIKRENFSNTVHRKDFSKIGFVCLCGAKFTGAGGLYVHQVKTMENEKFSCRSCGKKFHYFSGLKAHRKSAHKQDFTQEVGCSRCGQIFKSKKDRQGHLDERGQTCWLSGSYQSKDWEAIRHKRNLSSSSSFYSSSTPSSSTPSSQNVNSQSQG